MREKHQPAASRACPDQGANPQARNVLEYPAPSVNILFRSSQEPMKWVLSPHVSDMKIEALRVEGQDHRIIRHRARSSPGTPSSEDRALSLRSLRRETETKPPGPEPSAQLGPTKGPPGLGLSGKDLTLGRQELASPTRSACLSRLSAPIRTGLLTNKSQALPGRSQVSTAQ